MSLLPLFPEHEPIQWRTLTMQDIVAAAKSAAAASADAQAAKALQAQAHAQAKERERDRRKKLVQDRLVAELQERRDCILELAEPLVPHEDYTWWALLCAHMVALDLKMTYSRGTEHKLGADGWYERPFYHIQITCMR